MHVTFVFAYRSVYLLDNNIVVIYIHMQVYRHCMHVNAYTSISFFHHLFACIVITHTTSA